MLAGETTGPPSPGERYQLGPLIGRGGMGTVFEVYDLLTNERRAMKVLHAARSSPDSLVRFKREFRAAARLSHPHCLQVHELAQGRDGQWFYTMEYAPGGHLQAHRVREWQKVTEIARQVLAALDHIHGQRIIHRDIKPHNILIHSAPDEPVWVKLADFGISKTFDIDEEVGSVLGSLPYLAPEQLEGRADPRSDLYALALVMYELLAGRHPFRSPALLPSIHRSRELRAWRRRQGPRVTPLAATAPNVPAHLASLIMRMLEPRPDDRPPTAAAVFDELTDLLTTATDRLTPRPLPPLTRAPYLSQAALVGRHRETDALERFVGTVITGPTVDDPTVLFLTGPAGTGKSRLVAELVRLADEREARVETGIWRDSGGTWALGPLVAALTGPGFGRPAGMKPETETHSTLGESRVTSALPATEDPLGRYHQLGEALLASARLRPLLIVLEDAHWADATSLELLTFLIRRAVTSRHLRVRIGFVITHRPADIPALAALRSIAEAHRAATTLELGDLGPEATRELVGSMLAGGPPSVVTELTERLQKSSGGNPLLIGQTLQLLLAEGKLSRGSGKWELALGDGAESSLPRSLQEAVGDRAARLPLETKKLLAVAAVAGRQVDFDILQRVSGIHSLLLLDSLDEALRAEFLTEHPTRASLFQFVHDRVRDAIVSRLAEQERMEYHRRIASVLQTRVAAEPDLHAQLAYHLRSAGDSRAAERAYDRAGQHASGAHDFARAADLYAEALASAEEDAGPAPPRDLVERYADACLQCGRYPAALARYQELLRQVEDPRHRADLLRRCAELEWRQGNTAASGDQYENLLQTLGFRVPRSRFQVVSRWLGGLARAAVEVASSRKLEPAPTDDDHQREQLIAATCLRLSEVHYYSDILRSMAYTNEGFQRGRRSRDPRLRCEALSQQAYHFTAVHLFGLARRLLAEARDVSRQVSEADQAWNRLLHGMALGAHGDAHGYIAELREAERLLERSAEPMKLRQVWTLLGEALLAIGDADEGDAYGRKVLGLSMELGDERGRGWGLYLRGWAAARAGRLDEGRTLLAEGATAAERGSDPIFRALAEGRGALAALLARDVDEALRLSRRSVELLTGKLLRHPTAASDGVFLAAAAAALQRDGSVSSPVSALARRRRLLGRELAAAMRLGAPLFWAGSAAWARAKGNIGRAEKLAARAIAVAERYRLEGELQDVRALATILRWPAPR